MRDWQEGDVFMINGEPWTVVKKEYAKTKDSLTRVTLVKGVFNRDDNEKDNKKRKE